MNFYKISITLARYPKPYIIKDKECKNDAYSEDACVTKCAIKKLVFFTENIKSSIKKKHQQKIKADILNRKFVKGD